MSLYEITEEVESHNGPMLINIDFTADTLHTRLKNFYHAASKKAVSVILPILIWERAHVGGGEARNDGTTDPYHKKMGTNNGLSQVHGKNFQRCFPLRPKNKKVQTTK